jgi:lipopolysaccharide biosynthesis protein
MVHIYYHIYAIDGVESIIDEQLSLIKKHFDFPYILNVGISIADENKSISNILDILDKSKVRDVRAKGHEFVTLDLIEKDKEKFGDSDYILYIHTKGASKQDLENVVSWRHLMNYFNIEKYKNIFKIFEKTDYNTYGVLLGSAGELKLYSGNFWWAKASYLKTIKMDGVRKNRFNAEIRYIQNGIDWKPYSSYNREGENHYSILFKREEYAK